MTHPELCKLTAEKFVKKARLALWEYQSFASAEFPDVLIFSASATTLYEIKMSRSDFLADAKKDSRVKYRVRGWYQIDRTFHEMEKHGHNGPWDRRIKKLWISWKSDRPEEFRSEKPHLGSTRFFVCQDGMIMPHEVPEGWGLYWVKDGRFFKKKDSGKFRADVRTERDLVAHAMQRLASGNATGIMVNTFPSKNEE